jgi:hypothetical protein
LVRRKYNDGLNFKRAAQNPDLYEGLLNGAADVYGRGLNKFGGGGGDN